VLTRDGAEIELGPGEFFEIPPHHDAWVVGDEPWVSIDWGGTASYALDGSGSGRRVITNVIFTDVVDSTVRARQVGDARWRDLLEQQSSAASWVDSAGVRSTPPATAFWRSSTAPSVRSGAPWR
jgi:hypothetical protein